jgi:hypothetical protein
MELLAFLGAYFMQESCLQHITDNTGHHHHHNHHHHQQQQQQQQQLRYQYHYHHQHQHQILIINIKINIISFGALFFFGFPRSLFFFNAGMVEITYQADCWGEAALQRPNRKPLPSEEKPVYSKPFACSSAMWAICFLGSHGAKCSLQRSFKG